MKKAYTLAEILIALTILGAVAATSIPVLMRSVDNSSSFDRRFASIYNRLESILNSLVQGSSQYPMARYTGLYPTDTNGDLSSTPSGQYLCNSMASYLNITASDCSTNYYLVTSNGYRITGFDNNFPTSPKDMSFDIELTVDVDPSSNPTIDDGITDDDYSFKVNPRAKITVDGTKEVDALKSALTNL